LSASGWSSLDLKELCIEIIEGVVQHYKNPENVTYVIDDSGVKVESDKAHNLTLIINELTTNTMKHVLVQDKIEININFYKSNGEVSIIYKDNGPGYPDDIISGTYNKNSIGFDMIKGIAAKSMKGKVQFKNDRGAITIITFDDINRTEE